MVVYTISGATKEEGLNLRALGNGRFLKECGVLDETIELSHICLKEEERETDVPTGKVV